MPENNDWNFVHALCLGRPEAPFARNDSAVRPNKNRVYKSKLADGGGDLRHLLGRVHPGVRVARDQSIQGPALDLDIRIPHKFVQKPVAVSPNSSAPHSLSKSTFERLIRSFAPESRITETKRGQRGTTRDG